jgi:hypothetical protein
MPLVFLFSGKIGYLVTHFVTRIQNPYSCVLELPAPRLVMTSIKAKSQLRPLLHCYTPRVTILAVNHDYEWCLDSS